MQPPLVQTEAPLREVYDGIAVTLKQLANEPSVGLYFVQKHVHKAVPAMVELKAQIVESTLETEFVTQDVKDALNSVKTMKECGPPVIERMIKSLDTSISRVASLRRVKRDDLPTDTPEMSENVTSSSPTREHSKPDSAYAGYARNVFDSAYEKASSVASVARWNYPSSSKVSAADLDHNIVMAIAVGSETTDGAAPLTSRSATWFSEVSRTGDYVRGFFKSDSLLPTQALWSGFSKISGSKAREEELNKEADSEKDGVIRDLLEREEDGYAAFTAQRAADLEHWLEDNEELKTTEVK